MSSKNNLFFFLFLVFIFGCDKFNFNKESHSEESVIEIANTGSDIWLPSKLWQSIMSDSEVSQFADDSSLVEFTSIRVQLSEHNFGLLKRPKLIFELENGGGQLDLDQIINDINGSFNLNFKLHHEEPLEQLKVFFVNRARQRKVNGEIWGLPCYTYVDLTNFFQKEAFKKGILVNTYKLRHLNLILGDFIFSYKKEGKSYITRASFASSKKDYFVCQEGTN